MNQLAQGRFTNSGVPGSYYAQVSALTSKEVVAATELPPGVADTPLSYLFSPLLLYASVILFFALFGVALIIQIVARMLNFKRTITTLVVAFVVASIPLTLKTALEVTSFSTRAGPDEVPRSIQITQNTPQSVTITWETQAEKIGSVRLGVAPLSEKTGRVVIADFGKKVAKHTAKFEELDSGVEYEFEILSGKEWYNDNGKPLKFKLQ